ncbi:DUF535 family protein [Pseudaminobacter soli (ex Li et al. 2025)]|uniref:DUF535 family protein n=1 Tax=Pseudaminobacter soli (ex Li et al. 2025) TaxID=1295366 RepID=UPI002475386D|nr:DUF535 family protein [Mesorhizobium soli]
MVAHRAPDFPPSNLDTDEERQGAASPPIRSIINGAVMLADTHTHPSSSSTLSQLPTTKAGKHEERSDAEPSKQLPASHSILRQAITMGKRVAFRRTMAFWLRFAISPILTLRWLRFLQEFTQQHTFAPPHDDLVRKSLSAFLVYRMAYRTRFDILVQHFDVAGFLLKPQMLQTLWQGGKVEIGAVSGRDQDYRLQLSLTDHCGSRHEGVFALRLIRAVDRAILCTASFVFVRRPGNSYSIAIGGLQGSAQQDAKRAVISATRDLGGLRPKDAVLLVLNGMMARSVTSYIIAVSNSRHVINQRASARRRMRMRTDLDAYWIERGGVHFPPFGFRLPVNPVINERCESRRDIAKFAFLQIGTHLLAK